ncbi:WD repeat-containing protein 19-like [Oopsacas minuta]|uniref:WD repeat-containing protein 19-like n=1 Tax=Oopsacas minuta TaxID=111878 RepID=A0AAV7K9W4_9METZ|nr:WD repeat-containing protein 19-like [Oopsacas minuta]
MKRVFTIDGSNGPVRIQWQKRHGNFLAVATSHRVQLYARHGDMRREISLPGVFGYMDWQKDGDVLAVLHDRNTVIYLWEAHLQKLLQVDANLKDQLTWCSWSKVSSHLAVGTSKGSLIVYNHQSSKKVPVIGKHSKRITCGAWNSQNQIVLGSDDKTISLNSVDGDELKKISVRLEPNNIRLSNMKRDANKALFETSVSAVLGRRTLFLWDTEGSTPSSGDPPGQVQVELAFQNAYGDIVDYAWYGDGYLCIAFSNGFTVVVSTHPTEIGHELSQSRPHKNSLDGFVVSGASKVASVGSSPQQITLVDLSDPKEALVILPVDEEMGRLEKMTWTDDGQLLSVSTADGTVFTYLASLTVLGAACQTRVAYLTSLTEVTTFDPSQQDGTMLRIRVPVEPQFLGVGADVMAVGMNNRVWFFELHEDRWEEISDREYLGNVHCVKVCGDYAAVLFEDKILLHLVDECVEAEESRESRIFPGPAGKGAIVCCELTQDFLIYGTDQGGIHYFYLEEWQLVSEYKHEVGVRLLAPDPSGTRLTLTDDKGDGYVYSPLDDSLVEIPNLGAGTKGVLWDQSPLDRGVFATQEQNQVRGYMYLRESIYGAQCEYLGETSLGEGYKPLLLYGGEIWCLNAHGKIVSFQMMSHKQPEDTMGDNLNHFVEEQFLEESLEQALRLNRFRESWSLAHSLNNKNGWRQIAERSIYLLEVELAQRAYREEGEGGMVLSLESLISVEDKNLLAGHLLALRGEFDSAQDVMLRSSQPQAALSMRRDLLHWDQALQLARALSPEQIPAISREYAQQLEFQGDYSGALENYDRGVTGRDEDRENDLLCQAGMARNSVRVGEISRGENLARQHPSQLVKQECAQLLENLKLYGQAGQLYEEAREFERAASVYARLKQWNKVGNLLTQVTSPKIHAQYAKAKEVDGSYAESIRAYEQAGDYESIIRINLENLGTVEEAVRVAQESESHEGAKLVARHYQRRGQFAEAVEFLVLSKCVDEAFQMALQQNEMKRFAEIIGDRASLEDNLRIARYFDDSREHYLAGVFYLRCGDHSKALQHFLMAPTGLADKDTIALAIETVGKAENDGLTHQLIGFLMGETDGEPKDARYLFQLYMALKQYREAARTAIIIAREDQAAGNYRNARDMLLKMYRELRDKHIRVPNEMFNGLMLLHSYILVRFHVKRKDHAKAARLLIRVAGSISKFPAHVVQILTSTVIECQRAGLKQSAFTYAAMLMRPEYRQLIDAKWKNNIENIVRRGSEKDEQVNEPLLPCPFCHTSLPEYQLDCPQCKNNVPYCLQTGRHMILEDWTRCPHCHFPALFSELSQYTNEEGAMCLMCSLALSPRHVTKIDDPTPYLRPHETIE